MQYLIRYYKDLIEPKTMTRLIRALNWLRYWLETLVQYLVMKELLKAQRVSKEQKKEFIQAFKADVAAEVVEWKKGPVAPVLVLPTAFKQDGPKPIGSSFAKYIAPFRSRKYAQSRTQLTELADDIVDEPTGVELNEDDGREVGIVGPAEAVTSGEGSETVERLEDRSGEVESHAYSHGRSARAAR